MEPVAVDSLWFNTPDTATLCRGGGNGPAHPSQLYAIRKYVKPGGEYLSFLDYGCGSGTTWEAIEKEMPELANDPGFDYLGVDVIPKNVDWCNETFPNGKFQVNPTLHKIDQEDKSWSVVYSRHVVDHMRSFEEALDEHCRVASKLVIIVLWRPLGSGAEHKIKNIVDGGKTYPDEYTNDYSKERVLEAIQFKEKDGWRLVELAEGVGKEVKGWDVVIVLQRDESS